MWLKKQYLLWKGQKCRICHDLIVETKILLNKFWKMLLSEPLASLITFFRTSLIKFYINSQRMSGSFYHIPELIKLKNKGPKHTHLAML